MRVIIAGSRGIDGRRGFLHLARAIIDSSFEITEVISGTARGVDRLGERFSELKKLPIQKFPADWTTYGKRAGYLRNEQMAAHADALIALWDGESRGTKHMIDIATEGGLEVFVFQVAP